MERSFRIRIEFKNPGRLPPKASDRPVHACERDQMAAAVHDGDVHRNPDPLSMSAGTLDHRLSLFQRDVHRHFLVF
jgi:hypothetical protein